MRPEIEALSKLGPFPPEQGASVELVRQREQLYRAIERPITNDEARALIQLFGSDDYFGCAASLMHLIETAPGWPLEDCLGNTQNVWVSELRERAIRGGLL